MSTAVEFAPYSFGRRSLEDGMARPHHSYHEPYAPGLEHYQREQQIHPPSPITHLPRLPPMTAVMSTVAPSHSRAQVPQGHDPPYPDGNMPGYSGYGTSSPVRHAAPQFPVLHHDIPSVSRRPADIRHSPILSPTASSRSSDEFAHELRSRRVCNFHDQYGQRQPPRTYPNPQSPQTRRDSFHHDNVLPPALAKRPSLVSYFPVVPNGSIPPQLPRSPPSTQPSTSPRQETRSMSISNLLSSDAENSGKPSISPCTTPGQVMRPTAVPRAPTSQYRISVRQQPFAARSCGFGERDRRVIDPPPIVQLTIHDETLSQEELGRRLRHQFSVVHCSIWDEKGVRDMSSMPEDFRQQRRLMGTLVASPFVGQDEHGCEGCFFCFPDLSCRTPGVFRLKFALVVLDPARMHSGDRSAIVATAMSDPFQVFNAKDFPGMQASTPLTKRLKEQGCLISIKKGNEKRDASGAAQGAKGGGAEAEEEDGQEVDGEEGEDDEDGAGDGKSRPRKRVKR